MKNDGHFEIVLKEKPANEGLTKEEVMDLFDMLSGPFGFPVDISDNNGVSSALGFIKDDAADDLNYEFDQSSELGQFISSILNDVKAETDNCMYTFGKHRMWLSR